VTSVTSESPGLECSAGREGSLPRSSSFTYIDSGEHDCHGHSLSDSESESERRTRTDRRTEARDPAAA
jgi:hypothetical protein